MEFEFSINSFFPNVISKIPSDDMLLRIEPCIHKIIDDVGRASQISQKLQRAVTSTISFTGSNQTLYIMINPSGNSGKGTVLGILKVGTKKLFLIDKAGAQNELYPICILDFYIHESCQRMGHGKVLFDYFLKDHNILPVQVAIDRPSDKFIGFLKKHYGLLSQIPQVNNFVIYEGFFEMLDSSYKNARFNAARTNLPLTSNSCRDKLTHITAAKSDPAQSLKSCLNDSPSNDEEAICQSNLHRAEKPCSQSNPNIPTKFSHHRLW